MRSRRLLFVSIVLLANLLTGEAFAGWLLEPAVRWQNFALRPEAEEDTPNYYGYGAGLTTGYSIRQVFDIALFGQFTPATTRRTMPVAVEEASLLFWGGELAARFGRAIYVAGRGGYATYNIVKQRLDTEVPGRWVGAAFGASLGAAFPVSKSTAWQVSLSVIEAPTLTRRDETADDPRRLDAFSLDLALVYNHFENRMIENSIFGSFLESALFW